MSFYFPTDFEEDYKRTNLALRYGAISSSLLGGLILISWHTHTTVYAILFMLLLAWSTAATYMAFKRITIQPIINAVCDAISAVFLLWIMPIMIFTGVLFLSIPTFVMCFCYMIAIYIHGALALREFVRSRQ